MGHDMKEEQTLEALDIKYPVDHPIPSTGIAYYRMPPDMRDFIKKCHQQHLVIGFKYQFGELNFGVILGKSAGTKQKRIHV